MTDFTKPQYEFGFWWWYDATRRGWFVGCLIGQNLIGVCREYGQMQRDAGVFRGQMALTPNA